VIGRLAPAVAAMALVAAGCGGSDSGDGERDRPVQPRGPSSAELRRQLAEATGATARDFPAVRKGESLQALADRIGNRGTKVGFATSVYVPGRNRLAFGVLDQDNRFVYGKTAVYVATTPSSDARGPYPAPADLLVTDPPYRSQQAASEDSPFAAVYQTQVPLRRTGNAAVMVVTRVEGKLVAAPAQVQVRPGGEDPIPAVGDPAPRVTTDTVQSAGGDIDSIETRRPPDDMHETDFAEVVGERPVALLFATPQLCQSRVCGPVVDIAAQLKARYGDEVEFIHQEVYVDNDVNKGLRPPLQQFGLPSEPWLFTVDADGRVAARLEGSFGFNAVERAIRAAIRG
jgi:hypothetical protein